MLLVLPSSQPSEPYLRLSPHTVVQPEDEDHARFDPQVIEVAVPP